MALTYDLNQHERVCNISVMLTLLYIWLIVGIKEVKWHSPRGKDAHRTAYLSSMTNNEHFLVYDIENTHFTFRFESSSSSIVTACIEDYKVINLSNGKSRWTYCVYAQPSCLASVFGHLVYRKFDGLFKKATLNFQEYVKNPNAGVILW